MNYHKKIMIVDDNEVNRLVIEGMIEIYTKKTDLKFQIFEAENGIEAVNLHKINDFDLIFMDINMPAMCGLEATKLIRSTDLKVVIIGASASDDMSRQEIVCNGAQHCISKPINIPELHAILDTHLGY